MIHINELRHYGVLGMRWGIRRYQNKDGRLTAKGKARIIETKPGQKENGEKKGLSDKQKRYIKIGAAVAVTALAAYGTYRLAQSGKLDGLISKGQEAVKGILGDGTPNNNNDNSAPQIMKSITDAVKSVNPSGNNKNCVACSVAYDLRRRGLDVTAKATTSSFNLANIGKWYKGAEMDYLLSEPKNIEDAFDKVTSKLLSYGEGSRGILKGNADRRINPHGLGHAIAWEVVGGKVQFLDGQNGTVYSDVVNQIGKNFNKNSIEFARLDNLEINTQYIKEIVDKFK